jgi:hypothetical protein
MDDSFAVVVADRARAEPGIPSWAKSAVTAAVPRKRRRVGANVERLEDMLVSFGLSFDRRSGCGS